MTFYAINDRRCHACTHRQNSTQHMRSCVPKRYWPAVAQMEDLASFALPAEEAAEAIAAMHDGLASGIHCDCGFSAKNERGLRHHRRTAGVHREVMNG